MRTLALLVSSSLLGCLPSLLSNFEGDEEGWRLANNHGKDRGVLLREGGNPGGALCGEDAPIPVGGVDDLWYFVAPQRYLGDRQDLIGTRLLFDIRRTGIQFNAPGFRRDVVLTGGGFLLVRDVGVPRSDWTPNSLTLSPDGEWFLENNGGARRPALDSDFVTVLKDLNSLRLRGDYPTGPLERTCIDNVWLGAP